MVDDRYLSALRDVAKDTETEKIPDRTKKYTHDIYGNKLPCEYIQLNEKFVYHLKKIPLHLEAKNDYFGLCFGYPGSGKTHIMIRACLLLNHKFSLDDISFTVPQLEEWIQDAKPGSVGLFDEADAMAEGYYDTVLRSLVRNMQRIRTKGLVLFFNTPTMRDMHNYFAFRAKMVVYAYVPKNTNPANRGYIHLYQDQDLIADLFARMKKAYSETSRVYDAAYSTLKNNYNGRSVPDDWPINEKAYEEKKEAARRELESMGALTPTQAVQKFRDETVIKRLDALMHEINDMLESGKAKKLTQERVSGVVGLSRKRYGEILRGMDGT